MLEKHGILGVHSPIKLSNTAMEPTEQSFTITVTAAISGKVFWTFASKHAGSLFVRYLKLTIHERLRLSSPFVVVMLKEGEIVDDFCHLQDLTDTHELCLDYLLQKRRGPQTCQKLALTEAICHQLSREVWRILAHGLVLTECLPLHGRMTVNPLVLSIQNSPMLQETPHSTGMPCILESLLQANCDPNDFGHPPKSPLNEAVLRNNLVMVKLLVGGRANVNLQARGSDVPLTSAVRQQRTEMVKCLLEFRANPTVTSYTPTRDRSRPRWVGISLKELAEPDSEIANLIEHAIHEWQSTEPSGDRGGLLAQE